MADRLDYYFRQRVTEAELDLGFELIERAQHNLAADLRIRGIVSGAVPTPHEPVADLTIDLSAPARAYDRLGQRIFIGVGQRVDCSIDHAGLPTEVLRPGEERWLGVFLRFDRSLSDPRTDGNSREVFFRREESFQVLVRQGPAAEAGVAPRVPFEDDALLVCEVRRSHGQTQIRLSDIDTSRRQAFIFATGDAVEISSTTWSALTPAAQTAQGALDAVDTALAAHFGGTGRRHAAWHVQIPPRGFLASSNVEAAIHEIVDDLSSVAEGASGASRLGVDGAVGSPNVLGPGNVKSQLTQLLSQLNAHATAPSGAHHASAISATPHSYLSAPNVQAQLQELLAQLAAATASSGASRIGSAAIAGSPAALDAGTVQSHLATLLQIRNIDRTWLDNVLRRVLDDEWVYPTAKLRTVLLMPDVGMDGSNGSASPSWGRTQVSFPGGSYFALRALAPDALWIWPLRLPTGARLIRLRALVQPGAARGLVNDRVRLRVWSARLAFAGVLGPSDAESTGNITDDGTASRQALETRPAFAPVDNLQRVYFATATAGNPVGADLLFGLEVQYEELGPRTH